MPTYPVITVWQPYASLLAWSEKLFETRSWQPPSTQLRAGHILMIHAAVRKPQAYELRLFDSPLYKDIFKAHGIESLDDLPYGAIIAAAKFKFAHPVEALRDSLTVKEKALGNYADKRFAWELEIVKLPAQPIPIKGGQKIWFWQSPGKIA